MFIFFCSHFETFRAVKDETPGSVVQSPETFCARRYCHDLLFKSGASISDEFYVTAGVCRGQKGPQRPHMMVLDKQQFLGTVQQ